MRMMRVAALASAGLLSVAGFSSAVVADPARREAKAAASSSTSTPCSEGHGVHATQWHPQGDACDSPRHAHGHGCGCQRHNPQ